MILRRLLSSFILLAGFCFPVPAAELREIKSPPEPPPDSVVAITGARLIDGRGGTPIEDAAVVVRGSKIVAAGPQSQLTIPGEAKRFDARGLSVLPGLIDSHFHSKNDVIRPVEYELKHGITSFRDPGHPFRFYDAVRAAETTMPRVFLCGGHLDAHPPAYPDQAIVITDADHARRAVNDHVNAGASAIKIYMRLPIEHIAAACEAAAKRGVPVTAHLELVDADEAIRAGVRGIEHVTSFGTALAEPAATAKFKAAVGADSAMRHQLRHWLWSTIDLENSARLKPLLNLVFKERVFVSPTLAVFEKRTGDKGASESDVAGFANMLKFVGLCHRAGAKVVVGSHTSAPHAETGRAYQRELELLVEAGLSPLEAVTAGTLHNAQFFGVDERLGSIEPGKLADLVLIEGDPSHDIKAMKSVRRVMLNGVWQDQPRQKVGTQGAIGCGPNPKRVQRLVIDKPGVYENYLVDGEWADGTLVKILADDVVLRHCEIRHGKHNAVTVYAKNVVIAACKIHHLLSGSFGQQHDAHGITGRPTNLTVRNCDIGLTSGDSIQFDPGRAPWDNVLVEDCTLWTAPLPADAVDFKKGERPGENAVDTKQLASNPRSRMTIRNCLMHGWNQPGQIGNMAALNLKDYVQVTVENCLFRDNEICFRVRGGTGERGGTQVAIENCSVYDSAVAVRAESRIENLEINRLGIGHGIREKLVSADGGAGAGFENTGEFVPPPYATVLKNGLPR